MKNQTIKDVQNKILEIMKFIDNVCRDNDIEYFIMGGTALGAIRHGGFIPWDDDLDIFMTLENYKKFASLINSINNEKFVLQEWKITENYLEYAKVRMNGTTFIEEVYKNRKDIHQGIYVDIMILHKCPDNRFIRKSIYYASKYVTLVALSQRNWIPKNFWHRTALELLRILPNKAFTEKAYQLIYRYDEMQNGYSFCYFITKANYNQGIFKASIFDQHEDIEFEDAVLMGPSNIVDYLETRYGDFMKLPSMSERESAVHAILFDIDVDYKMYI